MGMIGISKDDETRIENEEELFSTIPLDNITGNEYFLERNKSVNTDVYTIFPFKIRKFKL